MNMASNFNHQVEQFSDKGSSSKLSSPRGDVQGGINDEEEDPFSAINNRISNLLIEDDVIPPSLIHFDTKDTNIQESDAINRSNFPDSPKNQGKD